MAKVLIGIVAVLACFALVDSLKCNTCLFSVLGVCFGSSTDTCTNTTTQCFTSKAVFPQINSFKGFVNQGCGVDNPCGSSNSTSVTSSGVLSYINVNWTVTVECCSTDLCNPKDTSGASTSTVSLSVLSVAALAALCGGFM
ncbi:hypothetical protein WMY93_015608 [Mugilogobius chulae]|uniref:UPAR/Ly6 domain-containing protein n=1 Tax=Mugilogobius chulae TaxID=88201 RepID=A0AAW0P1L1_9GOBI